MTVRFLKVGKGGALYLFLLLGGLGPGLAQESRLARQIDPGEKVVLGRAVHPWALTGKDQGKIPDEQTLSGIVLEFRRPLSSKPRSVSFSALSRTASQPNITTG